MAHIRKKTLMLIVCLIFLGHAKAQKVFYFPFDEQTGDAFATDSVSGRQFPVNNNFDRPERISGVAGNAIRFDGWSTWIEGDGVTIPGISTAMTIECWQATESFTAANSAVISQEDGNAGFSLEIEPYGKVVFIFWADGTRYVLVTESSLGKYQWNHIVATVDLAVQRASLYVNGEMWKEIPLGVHALITLSTNKMYVGRDTDFQEFAGFPLTMINGALDELSIYKNSFSAMEVSDRYSSHATDAVDLTIDPAVRHEDDHLRPQYHAMPNTSWTNECYGLIFHEGTYHLFFQKNPNGPYLYFMHWGHLTSPDLVSWKEEKIALSPSPGFDSFGVWSGTTVKNDTGMPVIFYTGVNGVKAGIGMAVATDESLRDWEEVPENPVIENAPTDVKHRDFRDPFLWKYGDWYYMIVGSGLAFNGGGYLFTYKSQNLVDWTRIDALYNDTQVSRSGDFWEMPFFYQLTDKDWMLCVTPLPVNGVKAKAIYWLGAFANEKFIPYDPQPKSLELISDHLLAPAVGTDENNRIVYMGIIPEDRSVEDQIRAGWRHAFSLPRALRILKDSTVGHIPHPNLCRLREDSITIANRSITVGSEFNLPEVAGNQAELGFEIDADSGARFSVHVLKNVDKSELTAIHFDLQKNLIQLDRSASSLSVATEDVREAKYVFDHHDNIHVRIFIDHSVLEVFIDNTVVFSCRVYPSKVESKLVDVLTERSNLEISKMTFWNLKPMRSTASAEVCEPDAAELPESLRREKIVQAPVTGLEEEESTIEVFPNPANSKLNLQVESGSAHITFFSADGTLIREQVAEGGEIDISDLLPGMYFLEVRGERTRRIFRLSIQ